MNKQPYVYKDFWIKIICCLIFSEVIDMIGRDDSILDRIKTIYFYTDWLSGFIFCLLIWEVIRFIVKKLDRIYGWIEEPMRRIIFQFLLGVVLPVFLAFLFTMAFMKLAYNQDIFKTSWLHVEIYTIIILILLVNVIYFSWFLFIRQSIQPDLAGTPQSVESSIPYLEVTKAGKTILLHHGEIVYSYLDNGYCYICPIEGEPFVTTYTLDEVTRHLGEKDFFRVNRQILISRKSCSAYKSIENGKIELDLSPTYKLPVIVSQKRARDFRKWIGGA